MPGYISLLKYTSKGIGTVKDSPGRITRAKQAAEQAGIHTIGDLTGVSEAVLIHHFGKNGVDLARHAQGIDDSPVVTSHETKSISHEVTFDRDVRDGERLRRTLRDLSEGVGRRLRQESLNGTTVRLKLRWSDFTTLSRQTTLAQRQ